ncbi:MAG TPA: hypothetical protein VGK22_02655 [Candidatus Angelobacter sp.]
MTANTAGSAIQASRESAEKVMPPHSFWRSLDFCNIISASPRRPKESLSVTGAACRQRLTAVAAAGKNVLPSELISIYTNAALVFYHNGHLDWAATTTIDALRLCRAGIKRSDHRVWLGCMLQPYINLGRLAFAQNNFAEALAYFEKFYEYVWKKKAFRIGDTDFSIELLNELYGLKNEYLLLDSFSASIYLCEGARTYLARFDFEGLLEFTERLAQELCLHCFSDTSVQHSAAPPGRMKLGTDQEYALSLVLAELQARALTGMGETDKASAVYANMIKQLPKSNLRMTAIYSAAAELAVQRRQVADARKLLRYARRQLDNCDTNPSLSIERYYAHFALGLQHSLLGDLPEAHANAMAALDWARASKHEVGALRSRILLAIVGFNTEAKKSAGQAHHNCIQQIETCMYPLERACALLELAYSPACEFTDRREATNAAYNILAQFENCGGRLPKGLASWFECYTIEPGNGSVCFNSDNSGLQQLYEDLCRYASLNGDGEFCMAEL